MHEDRKPNKVRPKPGPRAAKPVENTAGEQGQGDWSPHELVDGAPYHGSSYPWAPRRDPKCPGKIERALRYVEDSSFNARSFRTCKEAKETMDRWAAWPRVSSSR